MTREAEEADAIMSMVPAGLALYAIGNTKKMVQFLIFRGIVFAVLFFFSGIAFKVDLQNPSFLLLGSSAALLLGHAVYVVVAPRAKDIAESGSLTFIVLVALTIFLLIPILVFEVLLLAFAPYFFIADIVIGIVSLALISGKYEQKKS